MLYLFFSIAGLVLGLLITRRPKAVLLEGIRLLWLIIPSIFLAAAPSFLAYTDPDILWADNNKLLITLIGSAHAALLLIVFVNILSASFLAVNSWQGMVKNYIAHHKIDGRRPSVFKEADLRRQLLQSLAAVMLILSLFFLTSGLIGHMAVLLENNGMMPISADYLQDIDDPVVAEGIKNDALYFKRIIDSETKLSHLGQTIRAEKLSFLLPDGYVYLSSTEIVIATSLMAVIVFSMITDTLRRGRKLKDKNGIKVQSDDDKKSED